MTVSRSQPIKETLIILAVIPLAVFVVGISCWILFNDQVVP